MKYFIKGSEENSIKIILVWPKIIIVDNFEDETYFKALIHAFYISAIKVWKTTLNDNSSQSFFGIEGLIEESKKFLMTKLHSVYKTKFK